MFQVLLILGLSIFVNSQNILLATRNEADLSAPTPYQFSYTAPAEGGSSSHEESGDEFGRKTGSYSVEDEDGRQRVVQYVADENGFRASISTNEPGTSNQSPADVTIASSAEDGIQTLGAPAAAVIPIAPVAPVRLNPPAPRTLIRRAQLPYIQRRAPLSLQPAVFQIQPNLLPYQPTVVPIQPTIIPFNNRRINNQASFIPISQFLPISRAQQPLITIENELTQPAIVPIQDNLLQYSPYGGDLVFQPL